MGLWSATLASHRIRGNIGLSTVKDSSSSRWRSRPQDEIVWVRFGKDFVAFHRPSGKTHFLNTASKILLTDILVEPKDLASILEEFASQATDDSADAYLEQMQAMLDRIENLGLIERV